MNVKKFLGREMYVFDDFNNSIEKVKIKGINFYENGYINCIFISDNCEKLTSFSNLKRTKKAVLAHAKKKLLMEYKEKLKELNSL